MLVDLRSEVFREKIITFHAGLNVVIGDEKATNSIGKSSILMVIDFVFGGDSLLDHNYDIVEELGEHDYSFKFQFNGSPYYFRRGTFKSDLVYKCNEKYEEEEPISIDEYRTFLKTAYSLNHIELTFRSLVSLFSRIWGKENIDVKHPLHGFKRQRSADCIDNILKQYDRYKSIQSINMRVKELSSEKNTINKAFTQELIPKITKTKYKENITRVNEIDAEINDIKKNLAKYAVNISEIVNREVSELKTKKDSLLKEKGKISTRLNRIRLDLSQNKHIKSKTFSGLIRFFPEVDVDKITEVEEFHSKISTILKNELKESEKELSLSLDEIDTAISEIDTQLNTAFSNIDNPEVIVDRVHELANNHSSAAAEIRYFETDDRVSDELKQLKEKLSQEKLRLLKIVEDIVNDKTRKYVDEIYSEKRRSPTLTLSQNSYTFTAIEDTGTGKAYSNLILFDLAVLGTTDLPILIHDSVLYKNVENNAVAKLITLYISLGKQTFISIDEIKKYGSNAEALLLKNKVLELSNDNVLYIKDWRK